MYKNPSNDFQRVVNKLFHINKSKETQKSNEDIQKEGQLLWKTKYKNDRDSLNKFLDIKIDPPKQRTLTCFFKPKPKANSPQVDNALPSTSNSSSSSKSSSSSNTGCGSFISTSQSEVPTYVTINSYLANYMDPNALLTSDITSQKEFIS
ncbi:MAG: hypothetical protein QF657_06540, partial [Candidatus Nitrosopelagicus sp.]|nr:hypothetical protein [Candidatus Nitrosopelagicus sp.]